MLLSLPLLAALAGCNRSVEQKAAHNVLLVTVDTLRADRLRCYGYAGVETPALDALARRGALFENATAQSPLTPPSHASIFTGMNPNAHKVRNTGGFVLQSSLVTMAEIFAQQGYDTAAFVGAWVLRKTSGFDQGFATYDDRMPKAASRDQRDEPERRAGDVVNAAIAWLNAQSGKPFFLWVHVFDPHIPYDPPGPFREKYASDAYAGEVAYTDQELSRLFSAVKPGTITIVMSDHGESLGEHGEYTHGVFLYDSTLRIPLIMAGPGIPAGVRVREQARTIDILPTLMALLGWKEPAGSQGASLVSALSGKAVRTTYSYMETLYPKMNLGWSELRGIRTNRWKYIRAPKPELYDLAADPGETKNVIAQHPKAADELASQLAENPEKVEAAGIDQRAVDQLKSLGYVAGFSGREIQLDGKGADPKDRVGVLKVIETVVGPESRVPGPERVRQLQNALAEDPVNPALYYHLGAELEKSGRYDDALKLYQAAIARGLQNARLHSRSGDLLMRARRKNEAIDAYERAAQLDPANTESRNNLALAYLEQGRADDAERVFRWILTAGEPSAPAYNGLGLIAIGRRDPAAARGHFEKAVEIDPDLVEAHLNLGLIHKMMGDTARARRSFETFIAKAPRAQYAGTIAKVKQELAMMP